jgi:hypothetical protein
MLPLSCMTRCRNYQSLYPLESIRYTGWWSRINPYIGIHRNHRQRYLRHRNPEQKSHCRHNPGQRSHRHPPERRLHHCLDTVKRLLQRHRRKKGAKDAHLTTTQPCSPPAYVIFPLPQHITNMHKYSLVVLVQISWVHGGLFQRR